MRCCSYYRRKKTCLRRSVYFKIFKASETYAASGGGRLFSTPCVLWFVPCGEALGLHYAQQNECIFRASRTIKGWVLDWLC